MKGHPNGYGKPVEGRHESVANIAVAETERMPDLVSCRHQEAHLGGDLKVCPSYHSLIESTTSPLTWVGSSLTNVVLSKREAPSIKKRKQIIKWRSLK